jgi:hypothetical protein
VIKRNNYAIPITKCYILLRIILTRKEREMKIRIISLIAIMALACANLIVAPVLAAKPIDVQYQSNGFPSGQHFNLNLHGKDPATYTGTPTGSAVIVALNGSSTIEYLSNKKNMNNTELTVLDSLAENFGPDYDPAQVYLPYNILDESDNTVKPAGGYYVYGRILGKPNNGSEGPSNILLTQNFIVEAANSANDTTDNWPFGFDPDADLLGLGVVTTNGNLYVPSGDGTFERFDPPTDDPAEKGKGNKQGKSKAVEITDLFKWTGYVSDNTSLDLNNNGYLDIGDVPADQNGDSVIDETDLTLWLDYLVSIDEAVYYDGIWIFDVADMVISGQTIVNDGTKNFQIRFYPVTTTEFGEPR